MIYASFTLWLFLILFAGMGIYKLWASLGKPAWVNWVLFPGTLVSEMAYILGCLITGGEIKRATLVGGGGKGGAKGGGGGGGSGGASAPATEATPRLKVIGPVLAALISIVTCGAVILVVNNYLGAPIMEKFTVGDKNQPAVSEKLTGGDKNQAAISLPQRLPTTTAEFWEQAEGQIRLLRQTSQTWVSLDWTNWRVPLFVYLAACLAIRLAPAQRPIRPTLAAVVVIAAAIAIAGAVSTRFSTLMKDLWPLVSYVWASQLFILVVTLLVLGIVALGRALAGKSGQSSSR